MPLVPSQRDHMYITLRVLISLIYSYVHVRNARTMTDESYSIA